MTWMRFFWRHRVFGGLLHRMAHRLPDCPICLYVWSDVKALPGFVDALERGRTDIASGRWYTLDTETGTATPNPDWPADGPQPE